MEERTRIKICCIQSAEEAALAIRAGAGALGFVSSMPSGPGVIAEELISDIIASVPEGVETFLLTSLRDPEEIVAQQHRCGATTIQLVDSVSKDVHEELRVRLPGVHLVQVVHLTGPSSVDEAVAVARQVDALLLDSGNPNAAIRELGGTGRVHDWDLSRAIVKAATVPVYLAGGLNPENVGEAVHRVRPSGIDVCTGVRSEGKLDESRLKAFVEAVRNAETVVP